MSLSFNIMPDPSDWASITPREVHKEVKDNDKSLSSCSIPHIPINAISQFYSAASIASTLNYQPVIGSFNTAPGYSDYEVLSSKHQYLEDNTGTKLLQLMFTESSS